MASLTGVSVGRYVGDSFSSNVEKLQLLLVQRTPSMGVIRYDFYFKYKNLLCTDSASGSQDKFTHSLHFGSHHDLKHNHSCDPYRIK